MRNPGSKEKHTTRFGSEEGLTLVEILVGATLAVMIILPLFTMYSASQATYDTGMDRVDIQQIRMAGYESPDLANPACPRPKAATCIVPVQLVSSISIRGDFDGDGITEEVEYDLQNCVNEICDLARREREWDNTASTWGAWFPYEIVANNLEGLTFSYLPAIDPTTVRIQVDVRDTNSRPNVAFTVVSDMQLRNL